MQARTHITFDMIERLLNIPADWEVSGWESDDMRNIVSLKIYIDTTDLPLEARKRMVRVVPSCEVGRDIVWMIKADGPYIQRADGGLLRSRDEETVEYAQWRTEMINGLRCPKCFWLYEIGIGERTVPECQSCRSEADGPWGVV